MLLNVEAKTPGDSCNSGLIRQMKQYSSVAAYMKGQPEETRRALEELRACILRAAPEATEMFNYNIPAYALVKGGKRDQQIMIAGYARHVGLYPHPSVMEHFEEELKEYTRGKGSVHFPLDKPLPKGLITRMVKYRLKLLRES